MDFASSFAALLQVFAWVMTAPSFHTFSTLLAGWLFAPRRTVTGMVVAADQAGRRHHSIFHRVFSAARWSLDELGLAVFHRLIAPWLDKQKIFLAVDDTLARKRGLKVFGAGMHHDPLLSTRRTAITNWGHSWVILGVVVRFPLWPTRPFCLPILFRLYVPEKKATPDRPHRTRPELAVEMLRILRASCPEWGFHVLADSTYGGESVLAELPEEFDLTSRLRLDARLYDAPPAYGGRGRPCKRGAKLATPEQMLRERAQRASFEIYGRRDRARLCDAVARVHAVPDRPLRVVAVEPLSGGRERQAFYSTCVEATPVEILTWYASRWSVEVTIHDAKSHLGFEEPQGWTCQAVERTAPTAMILYALIVLWFVGHGHQSYRPRHRPWYRTKRWPSFADMLASLRYETLLENAFLRLRENPHAAKTVTALDPLLELAA